MDAIQIVGGGLAGLTLGIELRKSGVPVTVWDAGQYPRHRVCGEVLSGEGCAVLKRLGLYDAALAAGGLLGHGVAFFAPGKGRRVRKLLSPALCIDRYTLDALLARRFMELGGELRAGQRWSSPEFVDGVVRASGRAVQATDSGWRWYGIKAHARNVRLDADIEMHLHASGYVGLSQLDGERVNVCGLFRRAVESPAPAGSWEETLRGDTGSALHERLEKAVWDKASLCTVAGLSLRPRAALNTGECRIGDALTMISPITGNGMSMALEGGELAAPWISAYSRGQYRWQEARGRVAQSASAQFARRLRWAWRFHRMLFSDAGRTALFLAGRSERVWRALFSLTR